MQFERLRHGSKTDRFKNSTLHLSATLGATSYFNPSQDPSTNQTSVLHLHPCSNLKRSRWLLPYYQDPTPRAPSSMSISNPLIHKVRFFFLATTLVLLHPICPPVPPPQPSHAPPAGATIPHAAPAAGSHSSIQLTEHRGLLSRIAKRTAKI